jgi:transcriptional regulator with AAA-type ATPase domain
MFRVVAYAPDGVRRFPVLRPELLIGSRPECDIYLPYAGVAQQHAVLRYDGSELRIEDLGSRKGLLVGGKRVKAAALEVLDEIRVGGVTLLIEDVLPTPAAPTPGNGSEPAPPPGPPRIDAALMLDHLQLASEWVLGDSESRTTSEALASDLLADFGGGALFLLAGGDPEEAGLKMVVASRAVWMGCGEAVVAQLAARRAEGVATGDEGTFCGEVAGEPAQIVFSEFRALDRAYSMFVALPAFTGAGWSPVAALSTFAHLIVLGLVHHVGWYEPILPGHPGQQDLVLDSQLVVGESQAMKQVVEQLRAAIDPPVHLLLMGEPGVGKELLARSLHLSGTRRNGPFVTASCAGARPLQIEADLFGSEIPGKGGTPVRREGKLLLADGGTLFLDEIEQLPLELQSRLVRFLRTRVVEPAGSAEAYPVDVRLVAGSRGPLDDGVARDLFRVDLAYRLSQSVIEVPPLRQRREDLPLLIQSYINRFCHSTGKRVQGITVKAMSALLNYDYPGNIAELENIARHLVYKAQPGRPADVNLLPDNVRNGHLTSTTRVDASSELGLEHLVSATESAAIREALRRTAGNKSQAARLLGLSRNGLAIKMERYGI